MKHNNGYQDARDNLRRAWLRTFKPGMPVEVGDPEPYDLHRHAFIGTLVRLSGYGLTTAAIVRDQEDNEFQVSLKNVKKRGDE